MNRSLSFCFEVGVITTSYCKIDIGKIWVYLHNLSALLRFVTSSIGSIVYCLISPQFLVVVIFLIIKQTRCTNFSNLFLEWNSTCLGRFLCPSSGVFHCTHSNGICHTGLLTAYEQDQNGAVFHPDPARKLLANLYDIYLLLCTVKNSWWRTKEPS